MARPFDEAAIEVWRRRFQRFGDSGMAVERFCSQEGVSIASFYYWRKRLGVTTSRRRTVETTGRCVQQKRAPVRQEAMGRRGVFRPVTIASAAMPFGTIASPATPFGTIVPSASSSVAGVSIVLPSGTRMEIGVGSLDALRAVVGEVMRGSGAVGLRHHDMEGGGTSC